MTLRARMIIVEDVTMNKTPDIWKRLVRPARVSHQLPCEALKNQENH